jgi:hypothetical protein
MTIYPLMKQQKRKDEALRAIQIWKDHGKGGAIELRRTCPVGHVLAKTGLRSNGYSKNKKLYKCAECSKDYERKIYLHKLIKRLTPAQVASLRDNSPK